MYTGELFYETREDVEHLAMMEKQCGPFPDWMSKSSQSSLRTIFHNQSEPVQVEGYPMSINWPS